MTKYTNKVNCNCNNGCDHVDAKKHDEKVDTNYGFYSKVLRKPFDSLSELRIAEDAYFKELKEKEAKAAMKKADAKKVEDAFKALNAARRERKEKLNQLTTEYSEALTNIKKAFELGKKDINDILAKAEEAYAEALKEFTDAHPEGYHVTLRDGDFETTISGGSKVSEESEVSTIVGDLFNLMFGF